MIDEEQADAAPGKFSAEPAPQLQRLAEVRQQQGFSQHNMARRLGVERSVVSQQEEATADLPLSELYRWQKVLKVPVADLLVDSNASLSTPVMERARLVKLMKTTMSIREKVQGKSLRGMATMLVDQLLEIMPELHDVAAWQTVGQRRTLDDLGRIVDRQIPGDLLRR